MVIGMIFVIQKNMKEMVMLSLVLFCLIVFGILVTYYDRTDRSVLCNPESFETNILFNNLDREIEFKIKNLTFKSKYRRLLYRIKPKNIFEKIFNKWRYFYSKDFGLYNVNEFEFYNEKCKTVKDVLLAESENCETLNYFAMDDDYGWEKYSKSIVKNKKEKFKEKIKLLIDEK